MRKLTYLLIVGLVVAGVTLYSLREMMKGVAEMERDQYGHGEPVHIE